MTFQEFSVARNCLRPETVPLTILAIKKDFRVISQKLLRTAHFMGESSTGMKFSITRILNLQNFLYTVF